MVLMTSVEWASEFQQDPAFRSLADGRIDTESLTAAASISDPTRLTRWFRDRLATLGLPEDPAKDDDGTALEAFAEECLREVRPPSEAGVDWLHTALDIWYLLLSKSQDEGGALSLDRGREVWRQIVERYPQAGAEQPRDNPPTLKRLDTPLDFNNDDGWDLKVKSRRLRIDDTNTSPDLGDPDPGAPSPDTGGVDEHANGVDLSTDATPPTSPNE
jgi:hypothetical protein